MFSMCNPALVSHSDGMFTRYSASANRANGDIQSNDLIAFLSIVQKCNVDYLPITWQPAFSPLGGGGSAKINQSTAIWKSGIPKIPATPLYGLRNWNEVSFPHRVLTRKLYRVPLPLEVAVQTAACAVSRRKRATATRLLLVHMLPLPVQELPLPLRK
ncbi:hypothetical protein K440DRAFT_34230 [Wilcoxina mikolae CBS 423.85]|nr:hypothetical protein K440DRAFT_34230 [Wilcoxina mikolae CBS 423.85]